ncbi:50S ribosomal protein L20 [Salmonella enterica subsp. enterica]|nr:50S ribosomal protein L20 [Salmonella enterica subsp. enterica]
MYLHAHVTRKFETSQRLPWCARSRVYRVAFRAVIVLVSMLTVTVVNVSASSVNCGIARINAAARQNGISTANLHQRPEKASVEIDRKILADIAVFDKVAPYRAG